MKLFYITGTRDSFERGSNELVIKPVILVEELSSEYESSRIETELSFETDPDVSWYTKKIALFTSEEVEILMSIKNKNIPWGSDVKLKGMSFRHYESLFGYVDNIVAKEVCFVI